jgi:stress-induced morphogen
MPLQIIGAGPEPEEVAAKLAGSIESGFPDARVEVTPTSPGHFEIAVASRIFEGKSRVQQQQAVYKTIAHLMNGKNPPVHAIDRMTCTTP